MFANHAAFTALLKDYRPRWEALVEQFGAGGLLELPPAFTSDDPHAREMTRRKVVKAAMQTWERVKVQVAKAPSVTPPARAPLPAAQEGPASRAREAQQTPAVPPLAEDALPPRRFGTATLRGHTPSVPAPTPAASPPPLPDPDRADRIIADLLGGQPRGRFAPKTDDGD